MKGCDRKETTILWKIVSIDLSARTTAVKIDVFLKNSVSSNFQKKKNLNFWSNWSCTESC